MPGISHGADARRIASEAAEHVEYLSRTASRLEVADPVGQRFADVVGHGNDLHDAAEVWRQVADRVENATGGVNARLGGIDQSWQGADADAFLAHMQKSGVAGHDLVDSMRALSMGLDQTAETIRSLVADMGELISDGAAAVSGALAAVSGERRARELLAGMDQPAREMFESVEDVLRAFARFCAEFEPAGAAEEFRLDHRMPERDWDFPAPVAAPPGQSAGSSDPAVSGVASSGGVAASGGASAAGSGTSGAGEPDLAEGGTTEAVEPSASPPAVGATGAAVGGAGTAAAGGMAGGMMPMGGMMGGAAQNSQPRQNESRMRANPEDLFGAPQAPAPAVFGDKRKPEEKSKDDDPSTDPKSEKPKQVGDNGVIS